jgi:hypothetical protein
VLPQRHIIWLRAIGQKLRLKFFRSKRDFNSDKELKYKKIGLQAKRGSS